MTPCASAASPTDFVPVDGTVRVPHKFLNGDDFNLIDFGVDEEAVWAGEGNSANRPS
jgi:hypothetical protein